MCYWYFTNPFNWRSVYFTNPFPNITLKYLCHPTFFNLSHEYIGLFISIHCNINCDLYCLVKRRKSALFIQSALTHLLFYCTLNLNLKFQLDLMLFHEKKYPFYLYLLDSTSSLLHFSFECKISTWFNAHSHKKRKKSLLIPIFADSKCNDFTSVLLHF